MTFVNPYNFVPFRPPAQGRDHPPVGHDAWDEDRLSGWFEVRFTTRSPLILVDQSRATLHRGHRTIPLRVDASGRPLLPATTLRGALRAAFEALTNSRVGVTGHHLGPDFDPPETLASFSPAERSFGWASQTGQGAFRSSIRIEPPVCDVTREDVQIDRRTLPILSSPKPRHTPFYFRSVHRRGPGGIPQVIQQKRGWKFYLASDPQVAKVARTNQNCSVDVLPTGVSFRSRVHFRNLSHWEAGALTYLLDSGRRTLLRFGMGRPLGYGSVGSSTTASSVRCGSCLADQYRDVSLLARDCDHWNSNAPQELSNAFFKGSSRENGLAQYLAMARGFREEDVHYPAWHWFHQHGHQFLPDVSDDIVAVIREQDPPPTL